MCRTFSKAKEVEICKWKKTRKIEKKKNEVFHIWGLHFSSIFHTCGKIRKKYAIKKLIFILLPNQPNSALMPEFQVDLGLITLKINRGNLMLFFGTTLGLWFFKCWPKEFSSAHHLDQHSEFKETQQMSLYCRQLGLNLELTRCSKHNRYTEEQGHSRNQKSDNVGQ